MKNLLKKIVLFILQKEAVFCLKNNKPRLILVFGKINRSIFKDEIVNKLLARGLTVRGSFKGYNSEIGIPLSILGLEAGFSSFWQWFSLLVQGYKRSLKSTAYPQFLVLEIAVDNQSELDRLNKILKADCLVISDFESNQQTILDNIVRTIAEDKIILINGDFEKLTQYQPKREKQILSFGAGNEVNLKVTEINESESGQEFVLNYGTKREVARVNKFGIQSIYAELVARFLADYFLKT